MRGPRTVSTRITSPYSRGPFRGSTRTAQPRSSVGDMLPPVSSWTDSKSRVAASRPKSVDPARGSCVAASVGVEGVFRPRPRCRGRGGWPRPRRPATRFADGLGAWPFSSGETTGCRSNGTGPPSRTPRRGCASPRPPRSRRCPAESTASFRVHSPRAPVDFRTGLATRRSSRSRRWLWAQGWRTKVAEQGRAPPTKACTIQSP